MTTAQSAEVRCGQDVPVLSLSVRSCVTLYIQSYQPNGNGIQRHRYMEDHVYPPGCKQSFLGLWVEACSAHGECRPRLQLWKHHHHHLGDRQSGGKVTASQKLVVVMQRGPHSYIHRHTGSPRIVWRISPLIPLAGVVRSSHDQLAW
jgi:hypothetical protein